MNRSLPVRAYLEECIVSDGQEKYLPGPHQFSAFTAGEGISLLSLSQFAFFFIYPAWTWRLLLTSKRQLVLLNWE